LLQSFRRGIGNLIHIAQDDVGVPCPRDDERLDVQIFSRDMLLPFGAYRVVFLAQM
jgi:hypothetical protein